MLDLQSLEKQLDEVLAKETSETMSSWLNNRRIKNYLFSILGDGEFACISIEKVSINQLKSNITSNIQSPVPDCVLDLTYSLAA
ncbi:MAG: hypothetical protein ACRC9X_06425 [Bacteroidales bacterium]